jgi:hypothetical protein
MLRNTMSMDLHTPYQPTAIYYEDADTVEYVRVDAPCYYHRVDGFLTLAFDLFDRKKLVGFRLKGFKNFYLRKLKSARDALDTDFLPLVLAIEKAVSEVGNEAFDEAVRRGYKSAAEMAGKDGVNLYDFPEKRRGCG